MSVTDLRWQLRQLPRERDPGRDLWPAIRAGMDRGGARPRRRWLAGLSMAASLALAAVLFGRAPADEAATDQQLAARIVSSESREISNEYQAALRQFEGARIAPELGPSITALDRSVVQIQSAIAADPDSVFLLEQLRKTYSQRLALTRRAVVG
jgi:hypothetical protein